MSTIPDRLTAALSDRYTIERELGQGGMATVYLAHDLKHARQVAIKVLKPELAAVLGAERFVVEIRTTAALQHPHILPLFDSGTADGFLYFVMPYIQGETLRNKLDRETQLGIEESVRMASDIASALHYAHQHGVIHRDIKPENILLHDGRPMVADFGIALAVSAAAGGRMTETDLSLGTPHYMSPEQATAEKEISARSDVYSLGSVLYEMLAGQPPHLGGSAQQIIMKIIAEPVAAVTQFRKTVPPNVAAAVAKALEKLPADRFDSAKAFAEALTNAGYTSATVAVAGAATQGARRLTTALGVLVVVLGAALVWTLIGITSVEPRRVVRFSVPLSPDSGVAGGRLGIPRFATLRLAISADGNRIAYPDDSLTVVVLSNVNGNALLPLRRD
jgi:serine/threonine-protein kinase